MTTGLIKSKTTKKKLHNKKVTISSLESGTKLKNSKDLYNKGYRIANKNIPEKCLPKIKMMLKMWMP